MLGVVEELGERRVDVVHAAHRKASAAAATGPHELDVHGVAVGGWQLLQLHVTESRRQMVREHGSVARQRRRLAALVGQPVEPRSTYTDSVVRLAATWCPRQGSNLRRTV
jgi:hypothetical protein